MTSKKLVTILQQIGIQVDEAIKLCLQDDINYIASKENSVPHGIRSVIYKSDTSSKSPRSAITPISLVTKKRGLSETIPQGIEVSTVKRPRQDAYKNDQIDLSETMAPLNLCMKSSDENSKDNNANNVITNVSQCLNEMALDLSNANNIGQTQLTLRDANKTDDKSKNNGESSFISDHGRNTTSNHFHYTHASTSHLSSTGQNIIRNRIKVLLHESANNLSSDVSKELIFLVTLLFASDPEVMELTSSMVDTTSTHCAKETIPLEESSLVRSFLTTHQFPNALLTRKNTKLDSLDSVLDYKASNLCGTGNCTVPGTTNSNITQHAKKNESFGFLARSTPIRSMGIENTDQQNGGCEEHELVSQRLQAKEVLPNSHTEGSEIASSVTELILKETDTEELEISTARHLGQFRSDEKENAAPSNNDSREMEDNDNTDAQTLLKRSLDQIDFHTQQQHQPQPLMHSSFKLQDLRKKSSIKLKVSSTNKSTTLASPNMDKDMDNTSKERVSNRSKAAATSNNSHSDTFSDLTSLLALTFPPDTEVIELTTSVVDILTNRDGKKMNSIDENPLLRSLTNAEIPEVPLTISNTSPATFGTTNCSIVQPKPKGNNSATGLIQTASSGSNPILNTEELLITGKDLVTGVVDHLKKNSNAINLINVNQEKIFGHEVDQQPQPPADCEEIVNDELNEHQSDEPEDDSLNGDIMKAENDHPGNCNVDNLIETEIENSGENHSSTARVDTENCNSTVTTKKPLKKHKRIQKVQKLHICKICDKLFRSKRNLVQHLRIHSGQKRYDCSKCKNTFSQMGNLRAHVKIHFGEKPYNCRECNKSFRSRFHLLEHMRIHSGEKPYRCEQCNKTFRQYGHLSRHIQIHNGEKPYNCSECNKSFRQRAHLAAHMTIHSGEKPFHCSECNKSFRTNFNLSRHMKIHKGEKPYSCSECDKSFRQLTHLSRHMNVHNRIKQTIAFSCHYCGKEYSKKKDLRDHCLKCYKIQTVEG